MELFSRGDVRDFLANRQTPCVSLFMPTTRGPKNEDKTHWKNLAAEAEARLSAAGLRSPDAKHLLRPVHELVDHAEFWQNVSSGLAGFVSPEVTRFYRLPVRLDDEVVVADHFHIKPLIPLLSGDGRFYLLALSQKSVRLFQGTRHTVSEVDVRTIPKSKDEALQTDWEEQTRI